MKFLFGTLFTVLFVSGCSKKTDPAPTPTPTDPQVGSRWSYKETTYDESGTATSTSTLNLTGVSLSSGGTNWISMVNTANNIPVIAIQKRSDGWWYLPSPASNTLSSLWFKFPAAVNDTYLYVFGTCKVLSTSTSVTVPAGTFTNTYFVQGDDTNSKEDEFWFTNSGPVLVRFDTYDQRIAGPASNVYRKQSIELISYTR